jgi:hypothetical protein
MQRLFDKGAITNAAYGPPSRIEQNLEAKCLKVRLPYRPDHDFQEPLVCDPSRGPLLLRVGIRRSEGAAQLQPAGQLERDRGRLPHTSIGRALFEACAQIGVKSVVS